MSDELSPSQAAARIGATTRSVQRWIASGRLPARRVGGRWRVATDAIDAFVASDGTTDGEPPATITPIRTLFIANRGEIATRITRTCDRLGIRAVVPDTDGPDGLDLLDIDAVVEAARAAGADAVHPGFGFLAENADFAEAVGAAGIRWVGPPPAAIRAMGDKAAARRLAASLGRPDPRRLRRPGPVRRGIARGSDPGRLPDAGQAGRRRRRQGHADGPRAGPAGGGDRSRPARGCRGLRRRPADPGAPRRRSAARRDPGPVRWLWRGRVAGRTRLLDPAPPPEGARGGPVAVRDPGDAGAVGRGGAPAGRRGRLRRCRDLRVPARRAWRTGLPRDEHAAPGGAPRHGARDRPRPRRRSAADRRR